MSPQSSIEYLIAARRQTQIASLFYGLLLKSLAGDPPLNSDSPPSIETQAYFEGLITSVNAAEEKLTKGSSSRIGTYTSWQAEVSGSADLRILRNCMIHSAYNKTSRDHIWEVEPLDNVDTRGIVEPRSLSEYARIAFTYAKHLESLIDYFENG